MKELTIKSYGKNMVVGMYDAESRTIFINKSINHLFRNLNAFCVNSELLPQSTGWHTIAFKISYDTAYTISKMKFEELLRRAEIKIYHRNETQFAIPLALLDTKNNITGKIEKDGQSLDTFFKETIKKDPYKGWLLRTYK